MINLDSITLKDINQRLESADPKIREVLESEIFSDRVSEISDFYNFDLSDIENLAFHRLVAVTVLGFINPSDLPEAILTLIETDRETAEEVSNEIKKIIAPVIPPSSSLEAPELISPAVEAATSVNLEKQQPIQQTEQPLAQQPQNTPAPLPPTTEIPTEIPVRPNISEPITPKPLEPKPNIEPIEIKKEEIKEPRQQLPQTEPQTQQRPEQNKQQPRLTKAPAPQQAEQPKKPEQSAAPFVIHEDVEVKPTTEQNTEEQNPIRPMFYKPAFSQESEPESAPTKVKIDLGNEESFNPQAAPKRKDYTIHTPKAESEEDTTGPVSNSEVHPENIVDLKDLPR